jgi:hypothetical protein
MTVNQQKLQMIDKRDAISLIFKDILCSQNSSKYISPILQIFNDPGSVSISKGNQSPKLYKTAFLGG